MSVVKTQPSSKAIIYHNKKLLMFLRDNDSSIPDPNKWSLVGGEVDEGESFEQAVRREIKEEISVLPKLIKYLGKISTPDGNSHAIFLVKMTNREVEQLKIGDEGQKIKFFSIQEIRNLDLATNVKRYFELHADYLEQWLNNNYPIEPKNLGLAPLGKSS